MIFSRIFSARHADARKHLLAVNLRLKDSSSQTHSDGKKIKALTI